MRQEDGTELGSSDGALDGDKEGTELGTFDGTVAGL